MWKYLLYFPFYFYNIISRFCSLASLLLPIHTKVDAISIRLSRISFFPQPSWKTNKMYLVYFLVINLPRWLYFVLNKRFKMTITMENKTRIFTEYFYIRSLNIQTYKENGKCSFFLTGAVFPPVKRGTNLIHLNVLWCGG